MAYTRVDLSETVVMEDRGELRIGTTGRNISVSIWDRSDNKCDLLHSSTLSLNEAHKLCDALYSFLSITEILSVLGGTD